MSPLCNFFTFRLRFSLLGFFSRTVERVEDLENDRVRSYQLPHTASALRITIRGVRSKKCCTSALRVRPQRRGSLSLFVWSLVQSQRQESRYGGTRCRAGANCGLEFPRRRSSGSTRGRCTKSTPTRPKGCTLAPAAKAHAPPLQPWRATVARSSPRLAQSQAAASGRHSGSG